MIQNLSMHPGNPESFAVEGGTGSKERVRGVRGSHLRPKCMKDDAEPKLIANWPQHCNVVQILSLLPEVSDTHLLTLQGPAPPLSLPAPSHTSCPLQWNRNLT